MNYLNLNVPINSLGYGVVGYNIWKELRNHIDVTLWPINGQVNYPVIPKQLIHEKCLEDLKKQDEFKWDIPTLKIWHEHQLAERIGSGLYYVLPFCERSILDERRIAHLSSADYIICPSQWAADILNEHNFDPKYTPVVPMGVDITIFNVADITFNPVKCIFFNCGKWEHRKGHDILYKAFNKAFPGQSDVELWMMTQNPFLNEQETRAWNSLYDNHRVKIIDRVQYQEQLATVMKSTFCGVFPSRAEGWNLELLEMMACGKYVITTDYSAHTEFCNLSNSFLLSIIEEEPMYDGKWFTGECGLWASLDGEPFDQLVEHFRTVYEIWKEDPTSMNIGGVNTSIEYGWDNTAEKLLEVLNYVA